MIQQFLRFFALSMSVFFALVFATTFLHMIGGSNFVQSWRWVHDTLLIPIFWYIAPLLAVGFALDLILEKLGYTRLLSRLPRVIHEVITVFFILGSATLISQLFGGCIWFYPTEGWWRRFVPAPYTQDQMIWFYAISSVIAVVSTVGYWKKFLYRKPGDIDNG